MVTDLKKLRITLGGIVTGFINGLLGAGGGMITVPILKKEMEPRNAHANSVCIILPISIMSAINYIMNGSVTTADATPYLIWGVIGAAIGTIILQKINQNILKKLFSIFMIWAGVRMIMR